MAIKRTFVSFDYDNDSDLKTLLVGQSKNPDSPFEFSDASLKEPLDGDWKAKVRRRMSNIDLVIVLCGRHTNTANGVAAELRIAREEEIDYFLLAGYQSGSVKPTSAEGADKLYRWTWENLKRLVGGAR